MTVYIGTSGYSVYMTKHTSLFPKGNYNFLNRYASMFNAVEINNTFYSLPSAKSVDTWIKYNKKLMYSFKVNRYYRSFVINNPSRARKSFMLQYKALNRLSKSSVFLLQFSEKTEATQQLIDNILKSIPTRKIKLVIEGRHPSWTSDDILDRLVKERLPLVILPKNYIFNMDVDKVINSMKHMEVVYIRFHGYGKHMNYTNAYLKMWSKKVKKIAKDKVNVFCFFNNDEELYAPYNGLYLKRQLIK